MKKLKKLTAMLLSLIMVMLFAVPVLAAGNYTITIQNDKEGHTYEAYQIFAGDVDSDAEQEGKHEDHERQRDDDLLEPFIQCFYTLCRDHRRIVANFFHIFILRR